MDEYASGLGVGVWVAPSLGVVYLVIAPLKCLKYGQRLPAKVATSVFAHGSEVTMHICV